MTTAPLADAWKVQEDRERTFAAIRADDNLSDVGKQNRLHEAHTASAARLDELRAARAAEIAAEQKRLTHRAFAAPTAGDRAAYRDVLELAGRLDSPRAAEEALCRAERTDDLLLARAIGTVAAERGWTPALIVYGELFGAADALNELESFGAALGDVQRSMSESMAFSASPPGEVLGYQPEHTEAAPSWRP